MSFIPQPCHTCHEQQCTICQSVSQSDRQAAGGRRHCRCISQKGSTVYYRVLLLTMVWLGYHHGARSRASCSSRLRDVPETPVPAPMLVLCTTLATVLCKSAPCRLARAYSSVLMPCIDAEFISTRKTRWARAHIV